MTSLSEGTHLPAFPSSHLTRLKRCVIAPFTASVLVATLLSSARADSSFSNPYSSVGGTAGLNVDVYHLGNDQSQASPPTFASLYAEDATVSALTPSDTFVNSLINSSDSIAYSGTDSTATDTFLGSSASGSGASDTTPLATSYIREFGFIDFESQVTYTVNLSGNDDIAAVYLGGQALPNGGPIGNGTLIDAQNYDGSISSAPGLPNAVHIDIFPVQGVATTGWYPIEIDYYNQTVGGGGGADFNFSVSGGPVQFSTGAVTSPASYYSELNPLHQYSYTNAANPGNDYAPADQSNGTLVGNATVSGGALHTTGTPGAQGMSVSTGGAGYFSGSFSIEQWFTKADSAANNQTLFAFGSTSNYLVATPASTSNLLTLTLNNGSITMLTAAAAQLGVEEMLGVTFDATTNKLSLYINGQLVQSALVTGGFDLASAVSAGNDAYSGVNGFSPTNALSLNGATDEFRLYREDLSAGDIEQNYQLGPDTLIVPEPSATALLALGGVALVVLAARRKKAISQPI